MERKHFVLQETYETSTTKTTYKNTETFQSPTQTFSFSKIQEDERTRKSFKRLKLQEVETESCFPSFMTLGSLKYKYHGGVLELFLDPFLSEKPTIYCIEIVCLWRRRGFLRVLCIKSTYPLE
eukprot:TRINITY_DN3160_c0_g1_i2.p1 TRINITY_DN3160_c0_g1~~TRINITY_DN3160_c0_g1_i2.p1  ORF type:complete len:142 (-),score=23.31 TRINITY_DN3160_c0_g1_i2:285-653(-)